MSDRPFRVLKFARPAPVFLLLAQLLLLSGSSTPPVAAHAGVPAATGAPTGGSRPSLPPANPGITSEQAVAQAINDLTATETGYRLRHPRHTATFTPEGLRFSPRRGGPAWQWRLSHVGTKALATPGIDLGPLAPVSDGPVVVAYRRGDLVEQYLARENSIEQQFLLPGPLPLAGADLVIAGAVQSEGAFESTPEGWQWRTAEGGVRLGQVRVVDAEGAEIPATMAATATETRIVVDGAALAQAVYPVLVDPEIGANDFRLSDMGGDQTYDAQYPAVAYDSTRDQYLVVWHGDDDTGSLADEEMEIYGQLVDAATGAEIGTNDFRLSDMGPDGDPDYDALRPAVAYSSTEDEYLVVWYGDDNTGLLVNDEFEIYGQRVDAATGAQIGSDFRLSEMGPAGDAAYDALYPAVAYSSTENEYLVVWHGTLRASRVDPELEIYGQRVNAATGAEVGVNDFRLSDMGPENSLAYDAWEPAVAYNNTDNEYLVVWYGDDDTGLLADDEFEIYGQRVDAATGAETGANDFRLSDMGPDGDPNYGASSPAVAYESHTNQYLVVWYGDDNTGSLVDNEFEIFGQRLNAATGAEIGGDLRLSDMGPDGDPNYDAYHPAVAQNLYGEYVVIWYGDDDTGWLVDNEFEIYGQRLTAAGAEVSTNDRLLSDMGPIGDDRFDAFYPAVAHGWVGTVGRALVVWHGDQTPWLADNEFEIYGQRLGHHAEPTGYNDYLLSDMGPESSTEYRAAGAAVAHNPTDNEYLVVWSGDDNTPPLVDEEYEIFGQIVDAVYGVEIGAEFRLSDMGPDGDQAYDAFSPAVAYNSTDNEYLVVWRGDDGTGSLVDDEYEIFGQRVDGATGAEIGANDFRLSDMGNDGDPLYATWAPAVAYNSTDNQYLVTWYGDDNRWSLVRGEFEIFGQRVDGATGAEIGANDFRLSNMGPDGDLGYHAYDPAVAYNSTDNEYLVVWHGDDNQGWLVNNEFEIFGQRVDAATGAEVGWPDFRLSAMGAISSQAYEAVYPAVAYNSADNEYLVVWWGDDNTGSLVDDEFEIFGQRVDGATGSLTGAYKFRLSDMGPDGSTLYAARSPSIAYNRAHNEYLVVWYGDDNTPPLVNDEREVFGQRVSAATGAEIGDNDFRLSDMGPDGNANYAALWPAVAYNRTGDEFLVVWIGDDSRPWLVDDEFEVFGQRYASPHTQFLPLVIRLSP